MKNESTANDVFAQNYVAEREHREVEKYGPRLPMAQMSAHAHVYTKHSIEPAYGNYDRPINEIV